MKYAQELQIEFAKASADPVLLFHAERINKLKYK